MITRCSENATSSAVSGLPEWNFWPGRILSVIVLPSSLTRVALGDAGHELGGVFRLIGDDTVIDVGRSPRRRRTRIPRPDRG